MPNHIKNKILYNNGSNTIGLPKWSAFVVVGKKVPIELAANILIRTDSSLPDFRFTSNDKLFAQSINDIFKVPYDVEMPDEKYWEKVRVLCKDLKLVNTGYLNNNQILTAYIGGPYGWCNWNGDIFCNTFNIGKWPDVTEVAEDWSTIAQAFPQLDLKCHLYSGESCDENSRPIVEFVVNNGNVEVNSLVEGAEPLVPLVDDTHDNIMSLLRPGNERERGITIMGLIDKLTIVYEGNIPQYE